MHETGNTQAIAKIRYDTFVIFGDVYITSPFDKISNWAEPSLDVPFGTYAVPLKAE